MKTTSCLSFSAAAVASESQNKVNQSRNTCSFGFLGNTFYRFFVGQCTRAFVFIQILQQNNKLRSIKSFTHLALSVNRNVENCPN